jgi:aspartyl-tRNA synthetase
LPLDFLGDLRRTHMCGELRAQNAGQPVVLMGWVNRRRDLGNVIFIDIRDRSGMTQLVFDKGENAALHENARATRKLSTRTSRRVKLKLPSLN